MKKKLTTKRLALIGLMAALVYVGTFLRIKIPIGTDGTMLHLGNVFCLLAGLLLGPVPGGLAAGIGSALFDLSSEYASEFLVTFINKFVMGYTAGLVLQLLSAHLARANSSRIGLLIISAFSGSLCYTLLYIGKNILESRFVQGLPWSGVWAIVSVKAVVSLTNGLIAVAVSVILYAALRPALVRSGILDA